jgi:hypothetical protein
VHMTLMRTGSGVVGLWCWPVRLLGAPVVCGGCQVVRRQRCVDLLLLLLLL